MKIFSVFVKNLKTVSRNWSYFFVLLICPALLILAAGAMLNSFDPNYIRIGVYDETDTSQCFDSQNMDLETTHGSAINLGDISGFSYIAYCSLESCLDSVSASEVGACLHIRETENFYEVNVYLDSSRRIVEYYAKQLILQNVLGRQTSFIEQTSDELSAKLVLYSNALKETRAELIATEKDLGEQETLLIQRRESLRQIKQDFDSVYIPLKQMQPQLSSMKNDLLKNQQNLNGNISAFQSRKQLIESQIQALKTFLSSKLSAGDYSYSVSVLDSITSDLTQIDTTLRNIQNLQNTQQLINAITLLESIMPKLDSINEALIATDNDLSNAITKVQAGRQRILQYVSRLDSANLDLADLGEKINTKTVSLNFKENSNSSNNPVLSAYPILVAIIITFTSLILSNLFVLRQTNRSCYFRELISPTKDISFLSADYLINLFFVFIQGAVLFLVGLYWVDVPSSTLLSFSITIFLASSLFIFLGMGLGYIIKSQTLSMLLTIFIVMLFFILSELIVPVSLLSPSIRIFIELNPFVILSDILKTIFVLGRPISGKLVSIYVLIFFSFLSMIFVYVCRKINKKRLRD